MLRPYVFAMAPAWAPLAFGCEAEEAPSLDSADFAREERAARCDYLVRCGFATDRDACVAAHEVDRGIVQAIGSIEFDKVDYDAEAGLAYVDLLRTLGCEATTENARALEAAAAEALDGLVAAGDGCFADEECAGAGSICDQTGCSDTCCEGTCVPIQTLPLGAECPLLPAEGAPLTAFCEDTAYCAPAPQQAGEDPPATGSCQPRGANGSACDRSIACLDGMRCAMGQCFVLAAAGDPCNPTLQPGSCVDFNRVCDMGSSTCVEAPGDGEPCVSGACQPYAACLDDICVRRPGLGESCESTPPCQGDLRCRDGVCIDDPVLFVCVAGEPPAPDGG